MVPQQVSELQIFALQDGNVSEEAKKHYSQVSTLENTSHRLFYNLKKKQKTKTCIQITVLPLDQEICCEIMSPTNDREASPTAPQQYGFLNKI